MLIKGRLAAHIVFSSLYSLSIEKYLNTIYPWMIAKMKEGGHDSLVFVRAFNRGAHMMGWFK